MQREGIRSVIISTCAREHASTHRGIDRYTHAVNHRIIEEYSLLVLAYVVELDSWIYLFTLAWENQKMPCYRVIYEIDVDAESPEDAAREAFSCMVDPESLPPILSVAIWENSRGPKFTYPANIVDIDCSSL